VLPPSIVGIVGIVVFLLLIVVGMPIAFSFAIVGFIGVIILKGLGPGLSIIGSAPYAWASTWNLVCLPLFILMGQFAFQGKISRDLYDSAHKWVVRLPGGLALATTLACTGFAACTGSSLASAATMGSIAYPEMKKFHFDDRWSTGAIAAGGTLGTLIPPSILFIIYGVITKTSIAKLFIAGICPGLMISGLFLILIFLVFKRNPELGPVGMSYSWREKLISLKSVWGMVVLFVLVIGGLYVGVFAPSEAGAIGAFGAFGVVFLRRRLTKQVLFDSLRETLHITCFSLTILIGAMIFSTFLLLTGLPANFAAWVVSLPVPRFFVLVGIILLYIPLGCMIDALPMILLTLPIIFPVIEGYGFDPIWFGVVLVVLSELSLVTPPVGMNIYIVQGVTNVPLDEVIRGVLPFALMLVIGIAILVAFPEICLFLPNMMK
jgi:tripartite ATP-independent transporter DctM subunit